MPSVKPRWYAKSWKRLWPLNRFATDAERSAPEPGVTSWVGSHFDVAHWFAHGNWQERFTEVETELQQMAARLQLEQMRGGQGRPALPMGPNGAIPGMPGPGGDGRTGQYL